uniref:Uncharacterized protein n=1 Tax=Solanum tuberosum TaxID=4113 RepID=M1E112_SOLTU
MRAIIIESGVTHIEKSCPTFHGDNRELLAYVDPVANVYLDYHMLAHRYGTWAVNGTVGTSTRFLKTGIFTLSPIRGVTKDNLSLTSIVTTRSVIIVIPRGYPLDVTRDLADHSALLVGIADQLDDSPFGVVHRHLAPAFRIVVLWVIERHGTTSTIYSAMRRLLPSTAYLILSFRA